MFHSYTKEEKKFIADNVKGNGNKKLTEMFNKQFNLNLDISQIRAHKKNHSLSSGLDGRFKKGHTPFNKGKKGINIGGKTTQFKKGHKPYNYRPIGFERITVDGYTEVKVAEPNKWRLKQQLIWEKQNGPVPDNHVVIFGDRDKRNFDINNLILVSRQQLLILNRNKLIQKNADLTRVGIVIADVQQKISDRKKSGGKYVHSY
ncbi:HNH endonuclease signature motif containing protein [Abyssisolibacter fermentans]|uniref:HNH endonuclease signature motif containing protein n=1 Tax=Abyssisolibacter fermentans TaxID=1766203 RepID=UPI00082C6C4D|nr:HNH endonuclease signature motif containing protein [Abyssisolibacter fermentans]